MRNFFEQMDPWDRNDGSLHLYVLPDDSATERLVAAQSRLEGIGSLPPMPAPYLHLTLQRMAHFDDELKQADLSRLGSALGEALAAVPAFELELGVARGEDTAVVSTASPSAEWGVLHSAARDCLSSLLPGDLPAGPPAPHVTLAYATGDVPDDVVAARLRDTEPIGTLLVDTVHLVSVTARPEVGIFDFTHLANWDLARAGH